MTCPENPWTIPPSYSSGRTTPFEPLSRPKVPLSSSVTCSSIKAQSNHVPFFWIVNWSKGRCFVLIVSACLYDNKICLRRRRGEGESYCTSPCWTPDTCTELNVHPIPVLFAKTACSEMLHPLLKLVIFEAFYSRIDSLRTILPLIDMVQWQMQ